MDVMENDGDSESIYMNVEDAKKISNQSEIYNNVLLGTINENPGSAGAGERRKVTLSNMAAVGLGVLCVLLLAVITVLCIKHNNEMLQMQSSNDNMTVERDRLLNSNDNRTVERDRLQSRCTMLNTERDRLQSRYNIITIERDRLQSRYNVITIERDRLQSRYNIISNEKQQLLNLNNKLTSERNQLQSSYNAMRSERDALQNKLTTQEVCCPVGWTRFSSSCYLVSSSITTWEQSRQNCIHAGADLVIINSREEQDFVSRLGKKLWIGLTDRHREGQWTWVDNTPVGTGYWGIGEPNNAVQHYSDEDCAQVIVTNPATSNWNDIPCNSHIDYLCEKRD